MTRIEIRLECLKLTYAHGRDPGEAVGRAKVLEAYIMAEDEKSSVDVSGKTPKLGKKGSGNPDILS